jgi:hypothetical protein
MSRGMASGGTMPAREQRAFDVLTLYSILNFFGREPMVENLEANFSKAL